MAGRQIGKIKTGRIGKREREREDEVTINAVTFETGAVIHAHT